MLFSPTSPAALLLYGIQLVPMLAVACTLLLHSNASRARRRPPERREPTRRRRMSKKQMTSEFIHKSALIFLDSSSSSPYSAGNQRTPRSQGLHHRPPIRRLPQALHRHSRLRLVPSHLEQQPLLPQHRPLLLLQLPLRRNR
jgi:hypothetical protein